MRKGDNKESVDAPVEVVKKEDKPFTEDQLRDACKAFAETRKKYQAEFHLLSQEIEIRNGYQMIVHLHNPVQETLLNTIKSDMLTYLREKLSNNTIVLSGEMVAVEEKRVLYTNREKLDHLIEKNPAIKELKDRLGLDPDF